MRHRTEDLTAGGAARMRRNRRRRSRCTAFRAAESVGRFVEASLWWQNSRGGAAAAARVPASRARWDFGPSRRHSANVAMVRVSIISESNAWIGPGNAKLLALSRHHRDIVDLDTAATFFARGTRLHRGPAGHEAVVHGHAGHHSMILTGQRALVRFHGGHHCFSRRVWRRPARRCAHPACQSAEWQPAARSCPADRLGRGLRWSNPRTGGNKEKKPTVDAGGCPPPLVFGLD